MRPSSKTNSSKPTRDSKHRPTFASIKRTRSPNGILNGPRKKRETVSFLCCTSDSKLLKLSPRQGSPSTNVSQPASSHTTNAYNNIRQVLIPKQPLCTKSTTSKSTSSNQVSCDNSRARTLGSFTSCKQVPLKVMSCLIEYF